MADRTVVPAGGLSSLAATYVENALPTSADRIVLDASSGGFWVDTTLACRSIDATGYTGIFTHAVGIAINIGDATSAIGNLAFKFVNGMIYNKLHPSSCAINFQSTNATQQQVEFGGNTMGNITFKGAGSSYLFNDDLTCTKYYATLDIQNGTVNTNGKIITSMVFTETTTSAKTITLGASVINLYPAVSECLAWSNATGLTITANTATVNIYRSQTNPNGATFIRIPAGITNYLTINMYGGGIMTMASAGTTAICKDVNFYGAPVLFNIDDRVQMNASFQVTGMVRLYGYSSARRLRVHNGGDFVLPNATALYCEYTDFQSVNIPTYTVDVSAMLGGAGDLGGNTGMIFSPSINCYWYQPVAGTKSWSDSLNWFLASGGTGGQARKPLAQDNVIFDANSFGTTGCIVQCDTGSLRLSNNITWTGATNSPTWDFRVDVTMYGSLTMEVGVNITAYSDAFFTMFGNGTGNTYTLTNAGVVWPHTGFFINLASTNGCVLQDDFNGNVLNTTLLQVNGSLINFNNKNVTTGRLVIGGTAVSLGSGLMKLKGVGTVFSSSVTTVNATTGTIEINSQLTTAKTVAGNGKTYGNLKLSGNVNDTITFTGNNTWVNFDNTKTSAHTLLFTASSTNTFTGTVTKTSGSLWTLASTTTSIFTWSKASGSVTFIDAIISKSTASGGATWTANGVSINGGGNTGWAGFVANPFTWIGTTTDASDNANWQGGVQPSSTDIAIFTGAFNGNCLIVDLLGVINTWKGIIITSAYTGIITLNNATANYSSEGIEINGGTLTFTSRTINNAGKFKMTGGAYNAPAIHNQTTQGSTSPTWSVTGGTFAHGSGVVHFVGTLDAIINNTSARQFNQVSVDDPLPSISGTCFADGTFYCIATPIWNLDLSSKFGCTIAGITSGTGILRLIDTNVGTSYVLECASIPNLQFNGAGWYTIVGDVIVVGTLTITALATLDAISSGVLKCKGNISSAVTTILGNANTSIEGTLPEQTITGVGVCAGNVTINKTSGLVKLVSNSQPCGISKNFTVTKGQFNTNNFNVVFINNVTVDESNGGIFYQTALSNVQINGALTGRKIVRQKLYANGISL